MQTNIHFFFISMMMKQFQTIVLLLGLIILVNGSKRTQMSPAEIKACYEKSKDLNTGCDFIKCFHDRYHCDDESVTAWAYELCQQFPRDVILQFTPEVSSIFIIFCQFCIWIGNENDDQCTQLYTEFSCFHISTTSKIKLSSIRS